MTAETLKTRHALVQLLYAARMKKNLPLLLLVLGGALTIPEGLRLDVLIESLVVLIVSSAFITHINILTDAELDQEKKPHLMRWMTADVRMMKAVLALEAAIVLGGIVHLAIEHPAVSLGLGAFTLLTVLYSYNFLVPHRAVEYRLKAQWWGHFIVCLGAYLSLWWTGYFCSDFSTPKSFSQWLPVFTLVSLSEYSLFLSESAVDADEERRFGLKTFATLLGRRKSSILALAVWGGSALGLVWCVLNVSSPRMQSALLVAFIPAVLLRGGANLVLALRLDRAHDEQIRLKLPDLVFWGSRVITVGALAGQVLQARAGF